MQDFVSFKAEVKKQLTLRGWTHADLAKASGYSRATIDSLMCGQRCSDELGKAVAKALDIPEYFST